MFFHNFEEKFGPIPSVFLFDSAQVHVEFSLVFMILSRCLTSSFAEYSFS